MTTDVSAVERVEALARRAEPASTPDDRDEAAVPAEGLAARLAAEPVATGGTGASCTILAACRWN
ncbi:hypothetical protein FHS29_004685 [Saccharothrix tamanrassetensis]|uniref:Uncharacterized protein n=1 Tax=Saccharothrix tamanrassetensis TaxID=1051531 RepID=A0A841CPS5_9PSEU|nr:hypothetical protein [Saccharothrix tamanrassetensis]MBB5958077.1 hypothetical protein [Saccharothrix tamanrassetensis]